MTKHRQQIEALRQRTTVRPDYALLSDALMALIVIVLLTLVLAAAEANVPAACSLDAIEADF